MSKRKSVFDAHGRTLYRAVMNCWSTAPGLSDEERLIPAGSEGLTFDHLSGSMRELLVRMGAIVAYTEEVAAPEPEPEPEPAPAADVTEEDNG